MLIFIYYKNIHYLNTKNASPLCIVAVKIIMNNSVILTPKTFFLHLKNK